MQWLKHYFLHLLYHLFHHTLDIAAKGGAVAVGRSRSTEAVVYSGIVILVFNFILTK